MIVAPTVIHFVCTGPLVENWLRRNQAIPGWVIPFLYIPLSALCFFVLLLFHVTIYDLVMKDLDPGLLIYSVAIVFVWYVKEKLR